MAMDVGKLIPVDKVEFECIIVGFVTGRLPVAVGEIKGMKNLTVIKVQFGSFDIKVLKLCRRRWTGGNRGGEEEEMEKEEKRRGLLKEHGLIFWGFRIRMGP